VLLERASFPRFHIGESLLPYSNPVLRRIGFLETLQQGPFVTKLGATFISEDGERHTRALFGDAPGCEEPSSWHVRRADFDARLLEHARQRGAQVRRGNVLDVRFDPHSALIVYDADGERREVRVGAILDASGRAGVVARHLGLRERDTTLQRVAVFNHFTGIPRDPEAPGDIRIVSRGDMGWWWLIPLDEETTSVGVVHRLEERHGSLRENANEVLTRMINGTPAIAELMAAAKPVEDARFEGDYSYSTRAYAGERWMLLGDAGSFLDPVFSTGVHIALCSAMDAAVAVNDALGWGSQLAKAPLARYDRRQRARYRFFRKLVLGFYNPGFRDLFFAEKPWQPGYQALVLALAGNDRLSLTQRLHLRTFMLRAKLQNRFSLAPRIHYRPGFELTPRSSAEPTTPSPAQEKIEA